MNPVTIPSSPDGLLMMIEQHDDKHSAAHRRLRGDIDRLETQLNAGLQSLRDGHRDNAANIETVSNRPVDAARIMLTPSVVATIVVASLSIAGGVWASNSGIRSDVRDIITKMEAQDRTATATARFQDAQTSSLRSAIDDLKRQMELLKYEQQRLREDVTKKGTAR